MDNGEICMFESGSTIEKFCISSEAFGQNVEFLITATLVCFPEMYLRGSLLCVRDTVIFKSRYLTRTYYSQDIKPLQYIRCSCTFSVEMARGERDLAIF
jgi:hypothetical protein